MTGFKSPQFKLPGLAILKFSFLFDLPIKTKIWGGIGLVTGFMILVAGLSFVTLTRSASTVSEVVNESQPMVLMSMSLSNKLHESAAALGFYLLSQENQHKQAYRAGLADVKGLFDELKQLATDNDDQQALMQISLMEPNIDKFIGYEARMIELAETQLKNFPAIAYSSENLNPLGRTILQALSNMIMLEEDESISKGRKRYLMNLDELRYAWINVMNELRMFMILGQQDLLENMKLYQERALSLLATIKGKHSKFITFEQEEYIDQVEESIHSFIANQDALVEIFTGERHRTDA